MNEQTDPSNEPAEARRSRFLPGAIVGVVVAIVVLIAGVAYGPSLSARHQAGPRVRVAYQAQPVDGKVPTAADLRAIRDIVERRVNATGVVEPIVQTQGADRIVVELPAIADADLASIERLLGATGRVDFIPLPVATYGNVTSNNQGGAKGVVDGQPLPTAEKPLFSGDQVSSSNPTTDNLGQRVVGFSLKSDGAALFGDYTSKHVGEYFAIVLDGDVVSAPSIQSAITGGNGIITGGSGGFTAAAVNNLVTILRYGSLPFPITEISNQPVAP